MNMELSVFDGCRTESEVRHGLWQLVSDLLPAENRPGREAYPSLPGSHPVYKSVLHDLSFHDIRNHPHPVFILSEICRLLIKAGDQDSFRLCLDLSHKIYSFKCKRNESWYISWLYKGISQIGLKLTNPGITNVLFGMSQKSDHLILPVDRVLGFRALMSAAIMHRNLKMAMKFALDWKASAKQAGLKHESFCSVMVLQIFHLLYGDKEECGCNIQELLTDYPEEWKPCVCFLREWTDSLLCNTCAQTKSFREPYPLFPGLGWHCPEALTKDPVAEDFSYLCELRRNFCNACAIENLSPPDIEHYALCIAQWELPGPLKEFEDIMKQKNADIYHQFSMTRFMGKFRMQRVADSMETGDVIQQNAVILSMDVRSFSALCQEYSSVTMFEILNPLFKIIHDELKKAGGTILEFIGDCIIVLFNVFREQQADMPDIIARAIRCFQQVLTHSAMAMEAGLPEIKVGMGLDKGTVAIGYLGGLSRCHLTVIGNSINLATRIESQTKDVHANMLVSEYCFDSREPDIWKNPEKVNFTIRDLKQIEIKNMKPVHVYAVNPLLRYRVDFVPMGFVAMPEKGVVYIDTGNSCQHGIIDHHFSGHETDSACELVLKKPELLREHIRGVADSKIEFRVHSEPDLDCAATLYAAYDLKDDKKDSRESILEKLGRYVGQTDQGFIPDQEHLADSLYGIFMAHQHLVRKKTSPEKSDLRLLEAGLRVIDAAMYIMERNPDAGFSSVFADEQDWFPKERGLIRTDLAQYEQDISHPESSVYTARINREEKGDSRKVAGLWLHRPGSLFFKQWARTDHRAPGGKGYLLLAVDWSEEKKNRFVISVNPESGTSLKGLGEVLEKHESEKREKENKQRPTEPRRFPADNADPWYFGWGHAFTIVDSPREGTVLTAKEVREIHEGW
ncbi:MAG: adenylate/guanylate cyclase domain-containing protein [Desulfococcaceae bacterium]